MCSHQSSNSPPPPRAREGPSDFGTQMLTGMMYTVNKKWV